MIHRYFQDEMRYLHEAGKEFAQAHPEEGRFLNIDSVADRDPYVERLFEGFAFLTGRIRERLDDEVPELTESLFSLLWPHYLKPIPSLSILEFKPRPGLVQQTTLLARGTEVRSGPVGEEGVACRFRTTQEVHLQPMRLADTQLAWSPDGTSNLTLRFALEKGVDYAALSLNPVRLFFQAEDTVASIMHLFFSRHVARVVISAGSMSVTLTGQEWVQPAGLSADEGLLPYTLYSFSGCRLLQEYLTFRRKFWFVDLCGFDRFVAPQKTTEFTYQIFFDQNYPDEKRFKNENLRLHCTPIVNLFQADGEPVRLEHAAFEYRLVGDARYPRSVEIYSVDAVQGTEEGTGKRQPYVPFFSFEHALRDTRRYFMESRRIGPADRYETYITPGGYDPAEDGLVPETLSFELTCTNANVPREALHERMITEPAPDFSDIASFENILQPTLPLYPPMITMAQSRQPAENYLWRIVSLLSFNHVSVATLEALRGILELFDWTGTDANRKRIGGLRSVQWTPKDIVVRGAVMRGMEATVEVQDGCFADEGDLCLFGYVLSEFLSAYATINSFVHLVLLTKPSEQKYEWRPHKGSRPLV
jgi:type VI secretion system protein ImpG